MGRHATQVRPKQRPCPEFSFSGQSIINVAIFPTSLENPEKDSTTVFGYHVAVSRDVVNVLNDRLYSHDGQLSDSKQETWRAM